jgi:hypothetical protein
MKFLLGGIVIIVTFVGATIYAAAHIFDKDG